MGRRAVGLHTGDPNRFFSALMGGKLPKPAQAASSTGPASSVRR
ncbi:MULTISPECIES: hypothetical protein [Streptomyces]|nr:hypothetical protein [Streptomyces canarius]